MTTVDPNQNPIFILNWVKNVCLRQRTLTFLYDNIKRLSHSKFAADDSLKKNIFTIIDIADDSQEIKKYQILFAMKMKRYYTEYCLK